MLKSTPIENKFQRSVLSIADLSRELYPLSEKTYQDQLNWVRGFMAELEGGEFAPQNKPSKWFYDDHKEGYSYAAGIITHVRESSRRFTHMNQAYKNNGTVHIEAPIGSGVIRYIFDRMRSVSDFHVGRLAHFRYPIYERSQKAKAERFFHMESAGVVCNPLPDQNLRSSIRFCSLKQGKIPDCVRV